MIPLSGILSANVASSRVRIIATMRRILLIEDDPISQDIIRSLLATTGASVDVASDGISGLEAARSGQYDVLLIDYHLPEMDGYAIGRLLRHEAATAALQTPRAAMAASEGPILIGLTADRNGLAARRGSDAVFHAILTKPLSPAALFGALDRLCPAIVPEALAGGIMPSDPRRASLALWQERGLVGLPRALVLPAAMPEQRAALELCFTLTSPDEAEIVLLIERHGINQAKALRASRPGQALPIFALSDDLASLSDGMFKVEEPASWQMVATALGARIRPGPAPAPVVADPRPVAGDDVTAAAPPQAGADACHDPAAWAAVIRRDIHEPVSEIHRSFAALAPSATDPALKAFITRVAGTLRDVSHVAHSLALTMEGLRSVPVALAQPATAMPSVPAIDADAHAAMVHALGRSAVLALTDRLLGDIERLAGDDGAQDDAARLKDVAEMAATAAMFGFQELARVCAGMGDADAAARPDLGTARSEALRARLARDEALRIA